MVRTQGGLIGTQDLGQGELDLCRPGKSEIQREKERESNKKEKTKKGFWPFCSRKLKKNAWIDLNWTWS